MRRSRSDGKALVVRTEPHKTGWLIQKGDGSVEKVGIDDKGGLGTSSNLSYCAPVEKEVDNADVERDIGVAGAQPILVSSA